MLGLLRQVQGWVKLKGDTDGTKIGNSGDRLKVDLKTGQKFFQYEEDTVLGLTTEVIFSYNPAASTSLSLDSIEYTGENRAILEVRVNGSNIGRRNLYYGEFNGKINFDEKIIGEAETLEVRITTTVNKSGIFSCSVSGRII